MEPESDTRDPSFPLTSDSPQRLSPETPSRFALVDVCGLEPEAIDSLIETTLASLKEQSLIAVFVTDSLDYTAFRKAGVIFEALPPLAHSAGLAPDLDWEARIAELRGLIHRKWEPNAEIDLSATGAP